MRAVLMTFTLVAALLGAGCKSPCRQLAEKLCECATNSVEREGCLREAQRREANPVREITAEDQKACEALVEQCDCHLIDTAAGKRACGLAR